MHKENLSATQNFSFGKSKSSMQAMKLMKMQLDNNQYYEDVQMQGGKNGNLILLKQSSKSFKPKKKLRESPSRKNDINYQNINSLRSLDHDLGYHKK